MTSGMLQDSLHTSSSLSNPPRFRPFASPTHNVTKGRYITSNDPRGYIPVYEYPLNGQWIMMDIDDGYILWTGIWKALGNSKADIVKMIDSQPDLAPLIRRVRGGYLKIQGTWMPYEVALRLSRRVAWSIRDDLIPLFGPTFPDTCLSPDQPGYGQVVASGPGRRRPRRNTQPTNVMTAPREASSSWTVVTPPSGFDAPTGPSRQRHPTFLPPPNHIHSYASSHHPYESSARPADPSSPSSSRSLSDSILLSPITSPEQRNPLPRSSYVARGHDMNRMSDSPMRPVSPYSEVSSFKADHITLAPIRPPADRNVVDSPYALPPISALEDLRGINATDSATVLRRLRIDDDPHPRADRMQQGEHYWEKERRHTLAAQSYATTEKMSPRFRPYRTTQSQQTNSTRPSTANADTSHNLRLGTESRLIINSDSTHENASTTCDPSPLSPHTPHSGVSARNIESRLESSSHTGDQRRLSSDSRPRSAGFAQEADTLRAPQKCVDYDNRKFSPYRPW